MKSCITIIAMLVGAAATLPASVAARTASAALVPDVVNDTGLTPAVNAGASGAAVLRAQILLERARFSPGEIDAAYGSNMRQAIAGFQNSRGLPVTGEVDAATWKALGKDESPVLVTMTLSADDIAGPFKPLPEGMADRAKLDALGYASAVEALGEKFHASPALLKQLNPERDFSRVGEQLVVPSVRAASPLPVVAKVVVDKSEATVMLLDESGKVIAQYPASTGSKHDPLPVGD